MNGILRRGTVTHFERNLNGWAATNGLERKIHCAWKFPPRVWNMYIFPGSVIISKDGPYQVRLFCCIWWNVPLLAVKRCHSRILETTQAWNKNQLLGSNSNIFHFHPDPWGNDPIWLIFFQKGWFNHQPVIYPLKMGFPKRKVYSSNHPFSGPMSVSGRVDFVGPPKRHGKNGCAFL